MDFRILGPLCITHEGVELTPTAPKVRQVLAFLLVRAGKLVQVEELIDELWGEKPPSSAMTTLQTYIYKLRKDILVRCAPASLHTRSAGYVLDVPPERGDALRFELLSQDGRAALDKGDPNRAAALLGDAIALWRGPALADITTGEILSAHVTRLEEERLNTLEGRIRADLELGRHQQLVSELKMLVSKHSLDERFHAHLMTALYRTGRRYEALEAYQTLRRMLIDELGVEPSVPVQQLHQRLLESDAPADPAPGGIRRESVAVSVQSGPCLVPAQLPRDTPDFVARENLLRNVRDHLRHTETATARPSRSTAWALCITGMPGAGKTALALRAGHAGRNEFPDGQLYAELRGTTARPADPREVLADFLRAIGMRADEIPDSLQERGKLFRTWTTSRRVLVVLDDAHSVTQVAPLLPASPQCAVIITAGRGLYSLPGIRNARLGVLSTDEAVELIETVSGRRYTDSERGAAERAAQLAGRLPLALRSVGSRLAATPSLSIGKLAEMLADPRRRLDLLSFADLDVRARFDASYARLDPPEQGLFRLIGLLPQKDFSAAIVAQLVGGNTEVIEAQLMRLTSFNLLSDVTAVRRCREVRYRMHELLHIYARERIEQEFLESEEERETSHPARDPEKNLNVPAQRGTAAAMRSRLWPSAAYGAALSGSEA